MMTSNEHEDSKLAATPAAKQPWEPLKLTYIADIGDLVQGGGGKLSLTGGDPGEIRKERGSGR
jgi:hypothetical protein